MEKILLLLELYHLFSSTCGDGCLRSNVHLTVHQNVNYSCVVDTNKCRCHFNELTDQSLLALFTNISGRGYFDIKIYDGKEAVNEEEILLDGNGALARNTAVASRAQHLLILFPLDFVPAVNLEVKSFSCDISLKSWIGHYTTPTFLQGSRNTYPKNVQCNIRIEAFMGCSLIANFTDVHLGYFDETYKDCIEISKDDSHIKQTICDSADFSIAETVNNISIVLKSNGVVSERGKGFNIEYKVCAMELRDRESQLKFPPTFFRDIANVTRCIMNLSMEPESLPVLVISTDLSTNQLNVQALIEDSEIVSNHIEKINVIEGEPYILPWSNVMLLLEYSGKEKFQDQTIIGNYSSLHKECTYNLAEESGTFTSLRYGGKYPNNMNCTYVFDVTSNMILILLFSEIALADENDIIMVNSSSRSLRIDSSHDLLIFSAESHEAMVSFHSNGSGTDVGITVHWTVCGGHLPDAYGSKKHVPIFQRFNISTNCSYIIGERGFDNMVIHFRSSAPEPQCISINAEVFGTEHICHDQTITTNSTSTRLQFESNQQQFIVYWLQSPWSTESENGTLMSFGYPEWYPKNTRIEYVIRSRNKGETVTIFIMELNIGNDANNCTLEFLEFSFTNITSGGFEKMKVCGTLANYSLQSMDDLNISFVTGSIPFRGFNLVYNVSNDLTTIGDRCTDMSSSGKDDITVVVAVSSSLLAAAAVGIILILFIRQLKRGTNDKSSDFQRRKQNSGAYEFMAADEIRPISISYGNENYVFRGSVHDSMGPVYEEKPEGVYDKLREKREHIKDAGEQSVTEQPLEVPSIGPVYEEIPKGIHDKLQEKRNHIKDAGKQSETEQPLEVSSMGPVYEEKPDGVYDKLREKREHIKDAGEQSETEQPLEVPSMGPVYEDIQKGTCDNLQEKTKDIKEKGEQSETEQPLEVSSNINIDGQDNRNQQDLEKNNEKDTNASRMNSHNYAMVNKDFTTKAQETEENRTE